MELGFAKHFEKLVIDNSPAILAALGVAGTVTVAYLTGKASFRAAKIIADEEKTSAKFLASVKPIRERLDKGEEPEHIARVLNTSVGDVTRIANQGGNEEFPALDNRAKAELVWKEYVPAFITGAVTIAAIFGSASIGIRRSAALAAAFTISQRAGDEYQKKVLDKIGPKKEREIHDEVVRDRVREHDRRGGFREVILDGGDALALDTWTSRTFVCSPEHIHAAVNFVNSQINSAGYATLSDYYNFIGIPKTRESDEVGWNSDNLLEISTHPEFTDGGRPCIAVDFRVFPIRDYISYR